MQLQIPVLKSLRFKIFASVFLIVSATVGLLTAVTIQRDASALELRLKEDAIAVTDKFAGGMEAILNSWKVQAILLASSLYDIKAESVAGTVANVMALDPDIFALQISSREKGLVTEAVSRYKTEVPRSVTSNVDPKKLFRLLQKQRRQSAKSWADEGLEIIQHEGSPLLVTLNLPVMTDRPESSYLISMTYWLERIINQMPATPGYQAFVMNKQLRPILQGNIEQSGQESMRSLRKTLIASRNGRQSVLIKEFHKDTSRYTLIAVRKIGLFGLNAALIIDGSELTRIVGRQVKGAILWVLLLLVMLLPPIYYFASKLTSSLTHLSDAALRIAGGDYDVAVRPSSSDEVGALAMIVNQMSSKIKQNIADMVERVRMEQELDTARLVQTSFIPKGDQEMLANGCLVKAYYEPASECAGDWLSWQSIDKSRAFVCVTDVTGHGVASALITAISFSISQVIMRATGEKTASTRFLQTFAREVDLVLKSIGARAHVMTCFACVIDTKTMTISYVNAGHNFPLLCPADQNDSRLKPRSSFLTLAHGGDPLGLSEAASFKVREVPLSHGDQIVIYTDGLIENKGVGGNRLSPRSLRQVVAKSFEKQENLHEMIVRAYRDCTTIAKPTDDVSVVTVSLPGSASIVRSAADSAA